MHMKQLVSESGILPFLERYATYAVVGHKEPDGDCIGSQLALASFLERRGKRVVLLSSGPFTRTEIAAYAPRFSDDPGSALKDAGSCALVVLDCSSISRIGSIAEDRKSVV